MTVTTDVNVTSLGTFEVVNSPSNTYTSVLTIGRNLTVAGGGTFDMVSALDDVCNVDFSGASPKIGGGGSITFHSVTFEAGSPSITSDVSSIANPVAPISTVVVLLKTGCNLNLNSNNLTLTSTGAASPSLTGTATLSGTGTVTYNATSDVQTVPAIVFYNLAFSNAAKKNLASGTVSVGGKWNVTGGTADASVNNSTVDVAGSIEGTGPIKCGSGTISLARDWTNSGTFTCGTGTVNYDGTTGSQTVADLTYNNLTFSGAAVKNLDSGTAVIGGKWNVTGGTADASVNNASVDVTGSIEGTGPIKCGSGTISLGRDWTNSGTFTCGTGTVSYDGTTVSQVVADLTYNNLSFSGAAVKNLDSGTATVGGNLSVTGGTADASANNSTIDVNGNFTGTGPVKLGSGALSLGGNWSNSGTFTAGTGTVTLDGTAQQTVSTALTGSSAFYNLTITNASGADDPGDGVSFTPGVIFSTSETSTNNFTITTPSVRVQFNSGSTYTFNNINWNGGAAGTNIFFRNSALGSGSWLLNVSGTQTAVSFVNVARSDASSGSTINANDGTCYDAKNNINWFWGANSGFFNVF